MLHRLHVLLAVPLIATVVSCSGETPDPDVAALHQALQQEYPGAEFEVSFIGGLHHLELTVDTAVFGNYRLDDSQRRALGEEMVRIALDHFGAASELDSITIQFVQERSDSLLSRSMSMITEKFALADLR